MPIRLISVIGLAALVIFAALLRPHPPVSAQDQAEATISALQTRVAVVEATSQARGKTIQTQRTQIAELQGKEPEPSVTPKPGNAGDVAPLGSEMQTRKARIKVLDAFILPSAVSGIDFYVGVTLEVTNSTGAEIQFGRPDNYFEIRSSDGRAYEDSIFSSASLSVANDEWIGNYAPGETYQYSVAFDVPFADPNVFPGEPSGWVLIYYEARPGGYDDYELDLGL